MSVALAEALGQVALEPGRVYHCRVNGLSVELKVSESDDSAFEPMLDPWVELPRPGPGTIVIGRLGPLPPPDIPIIPEDGDFS